MKNNLLSILIVFLFLKANNFLSQTSFELSKMNVLYAGLDNPIRVTSEQAFDSLYLDNATISENLESKNEKNGAVSVKYIINTRMNNKEKEMEKRKLELYKNGKVISSREVRIKRIPDPICALDAYESGANIPKVVLKTVSRLFAKKPSGFDLYATYSVTKWTVTILNKDQTMTASGNGGVLSAAGQSLLSKAEHESKIFFDLNILAPDKTTRKVFMTFKVQ